MKASVKATAKISLSLLVVSIFLVSAFIPVLATHSTTVTVSPQYVRGGGY